MKKEKNKKPVFKITISIIVLLLIIFIGQAYVLPPQKVVGKAVLAVLPLPAALVNANVVTLGEYFQRITVAQKINGIALNSGTQNQILDQLIENKIAEALAAKDGISITSGDIDYLYGYLQKTTQKQDLAGMYGLSESQFKNQIVRPDAVRTKLAIWLSSNKGFNKVPYQKFDQAQSELKAAKNFDDVAKELSDDQKSSRIGGDLGFVSYDDVVPEIYQALQGTKDSNVHAVYSRFGIHLYKVVGTDTNGPSGSTRYHLKHIFIKTTDFNQWFNAQKNNYSIMRII